MIRGRLGELATGSVDNVLIYVSDSLRRDSLPSAVREMGVSGRGIATSTFTASGYPSILTGTYPSTHRVWNFQDSLAGPPDLLTHYDQSGIDATHVWQNVDDPAKKPPLRIPGETEETTIEDLRSPFVLVVHDRGGHMIYGRRDEEDRWSTHSEFFEEFRGDPERIERRYREGVDQSVEYFQTILETLRARDELANTLVVFTSDHGELLGEYGGVYSHGVPLVPELVEVPVVFAGAGLPRNERLAGILSTADVAPTALSALGVEPTGTEGRDLWRRRIPPERVVRTEVWKQTSYPLTRYRASGAWTDSGGHVRHLDPLPSRLLHLVGVQFYYAAYANIVRRPSRGLPSLLGSYLRTSVTYGDPPPRSLVDEHLVTDFTTGDEAETDRPTPDTEQLRELGYLE